MSLRPPRRHSPESLALRSFLGKQLAEVRYVFQQDTPWPGDYAVGEIDEVEEGVWLLFHDRPAALVTWAMEGPDEGLAVIDADDELAARYDIHEALASTRWSVLREKALVGMETLWHRADETAGETALALVLRFEGAAFAAIALGELNEAEFTYYPQALVVMHSQTALDSYVEQIASASGGVWETGP
jgi:hypothetical protein